MNKDSIDDIYPLTPVQQGILFHNVISPKSTSYVVQVYFDLNLKSENYISFKLAWNQLIKRHRVFRTAFVWQNLEQALQVVTQRVDLPITEIDLNSLDKVSQEIEFNNHLTKDRLLNFNINKPTLMRLVLFKLTNNKTRCLWTFHHLILDGWSVAIVLGELKILYQSIRQNLDPIAPPKVEFVDYINYLQLKNSKHKQDKDFWKEYLAGYTQLCSFRKLNAPPFSPYEAKSDEFDFLERLLSSSDNQQLLAFSKAKKVTLNTLLNAVWSLLLMRYNHSIDVVYASSFSGRANNFSHIDQIVGTTINTLPIRVVLDGTLTCAQFLKELQLNINRIGQYEHCSLMDIKNASEMQNNAELFDCLLVVENYPQNNDQSEQAAELGLTISNIQQIEHSHYPLACLVLPQTPMKFRLVYNVAIYNKSWISQIIEQFCHGLMHMINNSDQLASEIQFADPLQIKQIQALAEGDKLSIDPKNSIPELIKAHNDKDATALIFKKIPITYQQLNGSVNEITEKLILLGINKNQIIGLCMQRGMELIKTMLAVMNIGACYCILDPEIPPIRLSKMINKAKIALVLSDTDKTDVMKQDKIEWVNLLILSKVSSTIQFNKTQRIDLDDLAYVLFTSGSSGVPKGVKINHYNLLNSIAARHHYYKEHPSVFLLLSSFNFDSSVAGFYWTLTNAGTLIVSEPRLEQDMQKLIDNVFQHNVSHTLCLPSLYKEILQFVQKNNQQDKLMTLQVVILAGEAITDTNLPGLHRSILPHCELFNEYGPTEATVWSSVINITKHNSNKSIPIGRPILNTQIYILDQNLKLLPENVAGEICIAGDNLSIGYINDERLTQKHFIQLLIGDSELAVQAYRTGDLGYFNDQGELEYLGRIDDQINIRGHRIESGEIESASLTHPQVREAKLLMLDNDKEELAQINEINFDVDKLDSLILDELEKYNDDQIDQLINKVRE